MICNLFSVPTFSKIACFNTGSSFLPDILGDFKSQVENNNQQEVISACAELAFDRGYRFFALGYNSLCRSGPNVRDEYHKEGATSDNNCPNGIGVNKRIAVYTFGKSLAEDKINCSVNVDFNWYRCMDTKCTKKKSPKVFRDLVDLL